jgi:sec-independent protein translocase protein TatA
MPFGFRLGDLIIYSVLALLIFGPQKLPEIGAALGKNISTFKNGIKGAADESTEVDPILASIQDRQLKFKQLELQNIEQAIARKKAELNAYESVPPVEGSSQHVNTEMLVNHTDSEKLALEE